MRILCQSAQLAADLVDAYGRCTPERRAAFVQSARDAAVASGRYPNVLAFGMRAWRRL